jgi:amino acid transporter
LSIWRSDVVWEVSSLSQLRRVLRLPTIVSTSAGLAFAAINFLALVQVAALMAGDSAWLAIITAGVLCLLAAGVFGELNAIMPSAAGIRLWTRQGISDGFSLTFTLLYLTTILAVIAADSFILAQAIEAGVPQIPGLIWIILFLAAALAFNLRGVKMAGRVQDTTTYILLTSLILIAIAAVAHSHGAWHTPFTPGGGYLQAVAVGVFVFVGFEWVTPLAEEVTDSRLIPKGMFIAIGLIAIAFGLFILAMTHLLPASALSKTLVPQLLIGRTAFGAIGFWWMLLVTVITAGTTFNGSFVSASRLLYALARERSLPSWFSALNDRFVPHRALYLLFFASVVLAVIVFVTPHAYEVLISSGAALEAIMYVVAAFAVIGLRRRQPDAERSFKLPLGTVLPWLTAVIFFVLAIGAATSPVGIPGPVPWVLVLLLVIALLSFLYVRLYVPRLKAAAKRRQA